MARKHGIFGTLLTLGGLAAAGTAIYRNRELIRTFFSEASGTYTPEQVQEDETFGTAFHSTGKPAKDEPVIVIDKSVERPEAE